MYKKFYVWVNFWTAKKIIKNLMGLKVFQLEKNKKKFIFKKIFEMKKTTRIKSFVGKNIF